jgi:CSLREA domain-containing protein
MQCKYALRRNRLAVTIGSVLACGLVHAGEDANILVTTAEDAPIGSLTDECTLRAAVEAAQTQSAIDGCEPGQAIMNIIGFDPSLAHSTITLTEGEIGIEDPDTLVMRGPVDGDPSGITIDGGGTARLFNIAGGVQVGMKYLTLTNGKSVGSGYAYGGGAIRTDDTILILEHVEIANNQTDGMLAAGGGILAIDTDLTLTDSTITGNSTHDANSRGGGLMVLRGQLSISRSEISNNSTDGVFAQGGGLRLSNSSATLSRTQVTGNRTDTYNSPGGGIFATDSELTIVDSTIADNLTTQGQSSGAGIGASFSDITVERSTITGNQTQGSAAHGGGVFASRSDLEIRQSTVSGNSASGNGGGIYFRNPYDQDYSHRIFYSTVAFNSAVGQHGGIYHDGAANFILRTSLVVQADPQDSGCNKQPDKYLDSISTDAVCASVNTSLADIALEPLADNGGPTPTHALAEASVAIEAGGDCETNYGITADQRGYPRPGLGSSQCDVGAFEAQPGDSLFRDQFIIE